MENTKHTHTDREEIKKYMKMNATNANIEQNVVLRMR